MPTTAFDNNCYNEIADLLKKHHRNYSGVFGAHKRRHLLNFINEKTPLLQDGSFSITTKLFWIVNNLQKFPVCEVCGKDITRNVTSLRDGYHAHGNEHLYCSSACANSSQITQQKRRQTSLLKYGTEIPSQSREVKQKTKKTNVQRYGCDCVFQNAAVKRKISDTKLRRYGDEHWTNLDKQSQTNIERYGCKNVFSNSDVQEKMKHTVMSKYGCENPMQNSSIQHKAQQTNISRYGVPYSVQSDEVREKIHSTMAQRYGSKNFFGSTAFVQHSIEKYGTQYPCQCYSVRKSIITNRHPKLQYDGEFFDSKLELAVFLLFRDTNVKFQYQCEQKFTYEDPLGKKHIYVPDFKVENQFIEVKGSHFFRSDGTMYCPYRYDDWTDQHYEYVCSIYEAKHQCMIRNNVTIMRSDSICAKLIMKYAYSNYRVFRMK